MPRWISLGQVLLLALVLTFSQACLAGDASQQDIRSWVAKLDDDVYDTRETAVAQLIAAGGPSVPFVEAAVADANLEVVVRGLNVLSALAVRGESATTRDAAFDAMTRLGKSPSQLVAGHSDAFLEVIRSARQREAITFLEERGAAIDLSNQTAEIGAAWQGSEEDLSRLAYLYNIRSLTLLGPQVNDAWLAQAVRLPDLREITLKKAKVTTSGIRQLSNLKSLSGLHLLYLPLDASAVQLFSEMKQLSILRLYGTGLKYEDVSKLTAALPNMRLDIRAGGGFLGIGVQPQGAGVVISNVQPRSAAQQAGIEIGDMLLTLGGERIASFEQLQAAIAKFAPGEEIEVELLRTDKPEKIKIVLGEWESTMIR